MVRQVSYEKKEKESLYEKEREFYYDEAGRKMPVTTPAVTRNIATAAAISSALTFKTKRLRRYQRMAPKCASLDLDSCQ